MNTSGDRMDIDGPSFYANPMSFNPGRRRSFDEFAEGEEVQMDRVHRPLHTLVQDPMQRPASRFAIPNEAPIDNAIPRHGQRPLSWGQVLVHTVAYTTVVIGVLSAHVCRTVIHGVARAGRRAYVNRESIRQTCTAIVQSNYNGAKRRVVEITTHLPTITLRRRRSRSPSPPLSPRRLPHRSAPGSPGARVHSENGQNLMEGIECTSPTMLPSRPHKMTGGIPPEEDSMDEDVDDPKDDDDEDSDMDEDVDNHKDDDEDSDMDGDVNNNKDDDDRENGMDVDEDISDAPSSEESSDGSSDGSSDESSDEQMDDLTPGFTFAESRAPISLYKELDRIHGMDAESMCDTTESFSDSTMNQSQASDSSFQDPAGRPNSLLSAANPMGTGAQRNLTSSLIKMQPTMDQSQPSGSSFQNPAGLPTSFLSAGNPMSTGAQRNITSSLITPHPSHTSQSPKKSVAFFASPKTGKPVTGTKKFVVGEPINFPVGSSLLSEESTLSSVASNALPEDSLIHPQQATATDPSSNRPDTDSNVDLYHNAKTELQDRDRSKASLLTVNAPEEPQPVPGERSHVAEGNVSLVDHAEAIPHEEQSAEATGDESVSSHRQGRATSRTGQSSRRSSRVSKKTRGTPEDLTAPMGSLGLNNRRNSTRVTEKLSKENEEKERKEKEAEEAAQLAKKVEEAARREKEAEEAARKEREAEEARRKQGIRRIPKERIIQPLDATWEANVQQALDTPNMRQVLVTLSSGATLTRKDIGTLKVVPGRDPAHGWLNDEIIAACLQQVVDYGLKVSDHKAGETPTYHAFNTFFYKNLRDKGAQSVKRWATKAKIGKEDLLKVERVFIPVHQGAHWTLLVVSPLARTIEYFDSMGGRSGPYVQNAKLWLAEELGKGWKEEEWTVPTGSNGAGPRQTNGSDCGVFTCTTARMVVLGVDPMSYGGDDMEVQRGRMVAELLNGGLSGAFEPKVVF